nr:transporter [Nitrosovibrio sp. Nv17]
MIPPWKLQGNHHEEREGLEQRTVAVAIKMAEVRTPCPTIRLADPIHRHLPGHEGKFQYPVNDSRKRSINLKLCSLALALLEPLMGDAIAKEGGDQYPNGAENWLAGAAPPPGTHFLSYSGHYSASLHDGNGDKVPGASVSAWFNAFRLVHISEMRVMGGNYGVHMVVPIVHQRMRLADAGSITGLGDITVSPGSLAWHLGNWHWVAALDIRMPTGPYEPGNPHKSIGTRYWSIEPVFAVTGSVKRDGRSQASSCITSRAGIRSFVAPRVGRKWITRPGMSSTSTFSSASGLAYGALDFRAIT